MSKALMIRTLVIQKMEQKHLGVRTLSFFAHTDKKDFVQNKDFFNF